MATLAVGLVACQRPEAMLASDEAPRSAATPNRQVAETHQPSPGVPSWVAQRSPDAAPDKVKDAAIGAAVASALTREPALNGAQIEVDTASGRVILMGLAPDPLARARAAEVAAQVDGVAVVQNQLRVASLR